MNNILGRYFKRAIKLPFLAVPGSKRTEIPVFAYHSIDDTGSILSTSPSQLRSQLNWLHENGWRAITHEEYLQSLNSENIGDGRKVLLTFDDGYENFYCNAVPILEEFGYKATVFVIGGMIGENAQWLERDEREIEAFLHRIKFPTSVISRFLYDIRVISRFPLMGWQHLREVMDLGFDVQSHTNRHVFLTTVERSRVIAELRDSKEMLEQGLGSEIKSIAYPYGDCNMLVAKAAQETGYKLAFLAGQTKQGGDRWRIGRIGLNGEMADFDMRFMLSPGYSAYMAVKKYIGLA